MDNRLGFGVFLAPHHPIGEHPMLQLERDLELAQLLDRLGYDEFWVGEHHSGGWETIASPEMFLAAATGAIMKAISSDERAAQAMAHTTAGPFNIAPAQSVAQSRPGK